MIKVVGVASHARANYTTCNYMYKEYINSFDLDGFIEPYLNERGQKSILGIAVDSADSACAKKNYDFLKSKGIF